MSERTLTRENTQVSPHYVFNATDIHDANDFVVLY